MITTHSFPAQPRPSEYLSKARALFQLAGAADDAETRRAICEQAAVNLTAYRLMTRGRA